MSDEIVLSNSSMATYWKCKYRYYLSEVMRLPSAPNIAMALGTAVHAGVERLLKGSPLRPLDALREAFDREVALMVTPDEDPAVAVLDAEKMLATYTREVAPTFRPKLIEQKFVIAIEGVRLTGIIDGADEDLRDIKTTAGKTINGKKPSFSPDRHQVQLSVYRLGYKALTGNWPRRLLLDVLTRTGKYRQYELEPDTGGLMSLIRLTRDGIMRRDFAPTGTLSGGCHYCPYRIECRYSNDRD